MVEVVVQPRCFDGKNCNLMVVRDITQVMQYRKLKNEFKYMQLLVRTMSHEQLSPLNAILNLAEYHL